jgi:hypothetical protein
MSDNSREESQQSKRLRNEGDNQEHVPAVPSAPPPLAPSTELSTMVTGETPKTAPNKPRQKPQRSKGEAPVPTEYKVPGPPLSLPVTQHQRI